MILLVDNYDSFVYNLARYVGELGEVALVRRNDALTLDEVATLAPTHIIVSPGPCSPADAGISVDLIRRYGAHIPILGVCLGHQAIGAAYGGQIVRAMRPMHGKTSRIAHDGSGVFTGLASPLVATRYHSLVIAPESIPTGLVVNAVSDDGEIMGVRHAVDPVHGVQFHPESVLTRHGYRLLANFLFGPGHPAGTLPAAADGGSAGDGPAEDSPPPWYRG